MISGVSCCVGAGSLALLVGVHACLPLQGSLVFMPYYTGGLYNLPRNQSYTTWSNWICSKIQQRALHIENLSSPRCLWHQQVGSQHTEERKSYTVKKKSVCTALHCIALWHYSLKWIVNLKIIFFTHACHFKRVWLSFFRGFAIWNDMKMKVITLFSFLGELSFLGLFTWEVCDFLKETSLTAFSSSFSLTRLSSKFFSSVSVRPFWEEGDDRSASALKGLMGIVRETVGDMGFGLPHGWGVIIDTEGSLKVGRGENNCELLSGEINKEKQEIMFTIHSPTYTSHSIPHTF